MLLIDDLHIRVINAATGEVLRDLTLDTTRDYQRTGKTTRTTTEKHNSRTRITQVREFPISREITVSG